MTISNHRLTAFAILLIGIVIIAVVLVMLPAPSVSHDQAALTLSTVVIKGVSIPVELAQTQAEREQGLSGRRNLKAGEGMFFIFNESDFLSFWMKDMYFAIDMIFINDGIIVDIAHNMPPPTGLEIPATYKSKQKANRVLEVPADTAKSLNWQVGDTVESP